MSIKRLWLSLPSSLRRSVDFVRPDHEPSEKILIGVDGEKDLVIRTFTRALSQTRLS
jgi:hypothetical protein